MGEWQPRLGPSREPAAAPTQLEVLGRVPRQPVTWRQIGTTQLTPTNYYHRPPQTSSTDKSSSRWSPKSRLDGNDALSLLNLAPTTTNTKQTWASLRGHPVPPHLLHLFNLHPFSGSEVTISAISIRLFTTFSGLDGAGIRFS